DPAADGGAPGVRGPRAEPAGAAGTAHPRPARRSVPLAADHAGGAVAGADRPGEPGNRGGAADRGPQAGEADARRADGGRRAEGGGEGGGRAGRTALGQRRPDAARAVYLLAPLHRRAAARAVPAPAGAADDGAGRRRPEFGGPVVRRGVELIRLAATRQRSA